MRKRHFSLLFLLFCGLLILLPATYGQETIKFEVHISKPVVPTLSPAVRDLPPIKPPPEHAFGREMKRRDEHGFIGPEVVVEPKVSPLVEIQQSTLLSESKVFSTPDLNFAGYSSSSSPPDTTGDVGPNHFLQGINTSATSRINIYNKSGTLLSNFYMESLASGAPCNSGYCDPIVQYDELADRWMISEFDSSVNNLCVYVSKTSDPEGQWWAYSFNPANSTDQDYPKYGVWPDGYYLGINNGGWVIVLERRAMLNGNPASMQEINIGTLSGWGFQLTMPATLEGSAPPADAPELFLRPRDTEIHGGTCSNCDLMEMWELHVDWITPSNTTLTQLTSVQMTDWDQTICGTSGNWNCMPQPGTNQKIDPIREPIHYPLQYRNFGSYQTLVGCFVEDVDGTDHAALHWFEIRKQSGNWSLNQEGVIGGEANVHRSVGSAAMDGNGDIAVGYTRTGNNAPYYPSIYYSGRLNSDPLGQMTSYDNVIQDATNSKTNNERWGDYAGIGVDPIDDCSFWFTSEYGGNGNTRIASFKFSSCGCITPGTPSGLTATANGDYSIRLSWTSNAPSADTFNVYRAIGSCPQASYSLIQSGVATVTYDDNSVSGGVTYSYVVTGVDVTGNCETVYSNCDDAITTGACTDPPTFAGLQSVTNMENATCTLQLTWNAATAVCSGPVEYNIYRDSSPNPTSIITSGFTGTTYNDSNSLINGTTYYYIVRAVDTSNSQEDTNTVELSGVPTGPVSTVIDEDFEEGGGEPTSGGNWNHSAAQGTDDWQQSTSGNPNSPTHTFFCSDVSNLKDDYLVTPTITSLSSGATLSFYHTYAMENGYDGCVIEITTNGGTNWTDLGSDITSGGYTGTISTSYSSPIAGRQAWTGGSIGTETQVQVDLSSYAGNDVQIRFRLACDTSANSTGWYIDDVVIQSDSTCSSSGCTAISASIDSVTPNPSCVGQSISFSGSGTGEGTLTYEWDFEDDGNYDATGTNVSHTYGTANTYTVRFRVTDSCSTVQNATDTATITIDTVPGAPTINNITDVDACSQNGVQINYTGGASATSHNLYVDTVRKVTGYASGATYNPGDTASHSYVVRAINGACGTDSSAQAAADIDNGSGTPVLNNVTDNDVCALTGVTITYTAAPNNPDRHDLYVDTVLQVSDFTSGSTYSPGDSNSHTYLIRAIKGTCSTASNSLGAIDENLPMPAVPTLKAPSDGLTGISITPVYTWEAVTGAATYDIQIASDASFGTIVDSATGLTNLTYPSGVSLTVNTVYYWHVRAINNCGTGNYSQTWSFRTLEDIIFTNCNSPALAIPDNDPTGVTDTLTINDSGAIYDLNVSITATHTWVGDLIFTVEDVSTGTSVTVIDRPGVPNSTYGCSYNDINATLDDAGSSPVEDECSTSGTAINGTFTPNNLLSAFDGAELSGDWRITASDNVGSDTGTLDQWCVIATVGGSSSLDYSDLNASYGIATHSGNASGLRLGTWDADTTYAAGDDDSTDDGVSTPSPWAPGASSSITITVNGGSGWLVAWYDWNNDGDFLDSGEETINQAVPTGSSVINFTIPTGATTGVLIKERYRLYTSDPNPGQTPDGDDTNPGEVEDYSRAALSTATVPREVSPLEDMTAITATGTEISLSFTPGACSTNNTVYMGSSSIPLSSLSWTEAYCNIGNSGTETFDPGREPASGEFFYFVPVANNGSDESSYGKDSTSAERPAAGTLGCANYTQNLGGSCP